MSLDFCKSLPKIELHAHLSCSFSKKSIEELITLHGEEYEHDLQGLYIKEDKDIDESFKLYPKIQKLVTTDEAVYMLTHRAITEYAEDNVKYLELRSTPKDLPNSGMTRKSYMLAMFRAIQQCKKENLDIDVRLLVSIDRRHGVAVAERMLKLAEELKRETDGVVVGLDFSGDPKVGHAADFIPVFQKAVQKKLKLAIHLAELAYFDETKKVLRTLCGTADMRIGHGTFLHRYNQGEGHEEIEDLVIKHRIPVEVCLTSNMRTKTVESVEASHFKYWWDKGHPVILCTDGKGVYFTSLSEEYKKAADAFEFTHKQLQDISLHSVDSIFAEDTVKDRLRHKIKSFLY